MKKKNMKTMITRILACALLIAMLGLSLASCAAGDKVKDTAGKVWDTAKDGAEKIYDAAKDKITAEQTEGFGEIALLSLATGTEVVDEKDVVYQIIQATVMPENAPDKSTTWEVYWIDNQTGNEDANVTDYVTVMACIGDQPYTAQPGSNYCKVTCKQPFMGSTVGVRVTTVDGGYTAECKVTYDGNPSYLGFHQVLADGNIQFVDKQLTLTTGTTYTFKLAVDNVYHAVGDKFGTYEIVTFSSDDTVTVEDGPYINGEWIGGGATNTVKVTDLTKWESNLGATYKINENGELVVKFNKTMAAYEYYNGSKKQLTKYVSGNPTFYIIVRDTVSGVENRLNFTLESAVSSVSLSDRALAF